MPDEQEQLAQLLKGIALRSDQFSIEDVVPVFVPASLAEGGKWVGPIVKMQVPGVAITWVCLQPSQTMMYVSFATADFWESKGIDWRTRSMENLMRISEEVASHSFPRDDETYYAFVLMHDDGIGPSRLLLNGVWEEIFSEGYEIAIPERSVGVVLSSAASAEERAKVEGLVADCFENGTQPFVNGFFSPDLLMEAEPDPQDDE